RSYRSLLVYYDPFVVAYGALIAALRELLPHARPAALPPPRLVELPAAYGGDLGFDLDAAAGKLGLGPDELARLHAGAEYLVHFIGFTPGRWRRGRSRPPSLRHDPRRGAGAADDRAGPWPARIPAPGHPRVGPDRSGGLRPRQPPGGEPRRCGRARVHARRPPARDPGA